MVVRILSGCPLVKQEGVILIIQMTRMKWLGSSLASGCLMWRVENPGRKMTIIGIRRAHLAAKLYLFRRCIQIPDSSHPATVQ